MAGDRSSETYILRIRSWIILLQLFSHHLTSTIAQERGNQTNRRNCQKKKSEI
ncbi:hypothetical protein PVAP13_7KG310503 [Panicum virgatum]|uniref:Uncharacterized protein n=1 Tax=Panicum virgatum TaxID=38727 RepID=A0A8T0QKF5_PANVG|nr:hypothetical protein PVAP13_7KG310503 [Panicum virgatum]